MWRRCEEEEGEEEEDESSFALVLAHGASMNQIMKITCNGVTVGTCRRVSWTSAGWAQLCPWKNGAPRLRNM
jgi:hypothetical protein